MSSGSGSGSGSASGSGSGSGSGIPPARIKEYKDIFATVDTDGTGEISARELKRVMRMIGASAAAADVQAMINLADGDSNGLIDFKEFCTILELSQKYRFAQLWESFNVIDTDGSGTISPKELEKLLQNIGIKKSAKERKAMLAAADKNKDGQLDLDEYLSVLGYRGPRYTAKQIEVVRQLQMSSDDEAYSDEEATKVAKAKVVKVNKNAQLKLELRQFYLDEKHTIKIAASKNVDDLKKALAAKTGLPASAHRLYWNGAPLEEGNKQLYKLGVSGIAPVIYIFQEHGHRLPHDECFDGKTPKVEAIYRHFRHEGLLDNKDAIDIVKSVSKIMDAEETLVHIEDEDVIIVGDIHGQFFDLEEMFEAIGERIDGSKHWVFLGDYVDRGYFSAECLLFIYAAKMAFPDKVTLLRGNHEAFDQNEVNGSLTEFSIKYSDAFKSAVVKSYYYQPLGATVTIKGKKFLCCHGGISPDVERLEEFAEIDRKREVPHKGGMKVILWSDPHSDCVSDEKLRPEPIDIGDLEEQSADDEEDDWDENAFHESDRGKAVRAYGYPAMCHFLKTNDLVAVFRGHEQKEFGYECYKRGPTYDFPAIVTVFSAPNYTDKSLNQGAVVKIEDGVLRFVEYGWRLHPQYHAPIHDHGGKHKQVQQHHHESRPCTKNLKLENFLQFVYNVHPESLQRLTVPELFREYMEMFQTDLQRHGNPDDAHRDLLEGNEWVEIEGNLDKVLALSMDPKVKALYRKKSKAMLSWYQGYNHFQNAVQEESAYEVDMAGRSKSGGCC